MIDLHPAPKQLAAFRLGKLDEYELEDIERHVAECDSCCRSLKSLPDDSFISLVRQSTSTTLARDSTPGTDKGEPTWDQDDALTAEPSVPADLLDHPRYQILEKLGHGGMGVVYKAQHRLMERVVALKVLNPKLLDRPASVERFRREVKGAARLIHPNIVTAYDAEQAGASHFLVMEYVPGISLARLVEDQGPMPVNVASAYIRQAALGLQHAFECGMVHRDIKPQNLMVVGISIQESGIRSQQGASVVKILDFGLARFVSETAADDVGQAASLPEGDEQAGSPTHRLTQASTLMGTPEYIAPEQAQSASSADIRADIYSLGCTFYHLLAGHAPFPHGSAGQKIKAHLEDTPKPLTEIRPEVSADLARVLDKMMAKDPAKRYQTPAEVAEALAPFIKEVPTTTAKPPVVAAAPRRRHPRFALAASLAVALAIAGSLFFPPVQDFAHTVIRIATNRGVLEIEADDEDLQITIKQEGKEPRIEVVDRKTTQTFEVTAIDGVITLKEKGGELRLTTSRFELSRGGKMTFKARMLLADSPAKPKTDEELIQGTWSVVRAEVKGKAVPELLVQTLNPHVTLSGNRIRWNVGPGTPLPNLEGVFHLDASKTPKTIDIVVFDKAKNQRIVVLGIYKLDGDALEICHAVEPSQPAERPKDFKTDAESFVGHVVLKREKPDPDRPAPSKTDQEVLQGKWLCVDAEHDQGKVPGNGIAAVWFEFDGTRANCRFVGPWAGFATKDSDFVAEGRFTLDPAKSPKEVAFSFEGDEGFPVQGIYMFEPDQDHLTLCLNRRGGLKDFKAYGAPTLTYRFSLVRDRRHSNTEFQPLFNGKDLDGWTGSIKYWKWEQGRLVFRKPPGGLPHSENGGDALLWKLLQGQKVYRDFELKFQARMKGRGFCGLYFRSALKSTKAKTWLEGFRLNIGLQEWGSLVERDSFLYRTSDRKALDKVLNKDWFNDYSIKCQGKRVTIKVNGLTTVDGIGIEFQELRSEPIPIEGTFGFLVRADSAPDEIVFRNIAIRELPSPPAAQQPAHADKPLSSGPKVGEKVAGFLPVHLSGAHMGKRSDLVEEWGANPVVLVFTRELSSPLLSLITKTNAAIGQHKDAKLHGAVVFLGDDDWLTDRRLIGMMNDAKLKEIVLGLDKAAGPPAYKLHKDAGVTVLLYARQTVKANFTFAKGGMTEADATMILDDLPKILPTK